jgi:hypothetical protein
MAVLFVHIGQSIAVPIGIASTISNATTVKLVANTMADDEAHDDHRRGLFKPYAA